MYLISTNWLPMVSTSNDKPRMASHIKMMSPTTMPIDVKAPWINPDVAVLADTVNTLTLGIKARMTMAVNKVAMLLYDILISISLVID